MLSLMFYSLSSMTLSALVVLYAIATRIRFYPIVVFLFTSKLASVTMINLAVVFMILLGFGCTRLFLGRLRDAETDAVWENMRFSVTETAFALTTFRDELNARVGVLFGVMLFAKVFHLLNEARVEHVEQAQQTTWKAHARMISLSLTLFLLNSLVLSGCVIHLSTYGPSVYLLFAFEHAVLLVGLLATMCRYAIAVYDLNFVHGRWQNKSQYEMYVALVSDALQFTAYSVFAGVVFTYYGMPIHLMRSLYMTFRNLTERATHFIRFRRIMHSLNERFPDATQAELDATDKVCIICREDMDIGGPAGSPKKLQCGHLFHSVCLQNWLERQFSCPTCRRAIPIGIPAQNAPAAAQVAAQGQAGQQQQPAANAEGVRPPGQAPQQQQQQPQVPAPQNQERREEGLNGPQMQNNNNQNQNHVATEQPAADVQRNRPVEANENAASAARIRASLDRRFPAERPVETASSASGNDGEEEKTSTEAAPARARTPLSPKMPTRRRGVGGIHEVNDDVLFEDLTDDVYDRSKNNRLKRAELEERVYQAQAEAARAAQEFALTVLQLQMTKRTSSLNQAGI